MSSKLLIFCMLIGWSVAATVSNGQVISKRQEAVKDSYLEALEYSHNSASIQGVEGNGFTNFFRPVRQAFSEFGFGRAGAAAAAIAVPAVTIAGLALLAPLALGRKKRDLDAVSSEEFEPLEAIRSKVEQIYTDVVSSEDCIERFICELASAGKDFQYKDSVVRLLNDFAPDSYKKYMKTLKAAAYSGDSTKCRQIKCRPVGL